MSRHTGTTKQLHAYGSSARRFKMVFSGILPKCSHNRSGLRLVGSVLTYRSTEQKALPIPPQKNKGDPTTPCCVFTSLGNPWKSCASPSCGSCHTICERVDRVEDLTCQCRRAILWDREYIKSDDQDLVFSALNRLGVV
jgi:hypothetical protein